MQILFEDDGDLKAGTVRSATEASFQVDSASGKRVKVKASAVLLRFEHPRAEELLAAARTEAARMDADFLWQCAAQQEFGFEQLALEYCGRDPSPVEAAAVLIALQSAPIYFQRKGRGRFRPAAPEVLRAALASVERRRMQEELRAQMVRDLVGGRLPPTIAAMGENLLLRPDRNSAEFKAVEQAAFELQTTALRLLLARGAIRSPYHWHLQSFLARAFPRGVEFASDLPAPRTRSWDLPAAAAPVFSIDDSGTTEIDDAFSVRRTDAALTVGIHIAAPALALVPGHALDAIARTRLSTVYAPGIKYTMLPDAWIEAFSLTQGRNVAAISLYLELDPASYALTGCRTALETVHVAANLRLDQLETLITEERIETGQLPLAFAQELTVLWRLVNRLRSEREQLRGRPEPKAREEIAVLLSGEGEEARVQMQVRRRDAPLDRIVSELMIYANSYWGAWLEKMGLVGVYRSQALGRVRMSTTPSLHEGIGVSHYAWCTSPLRRYVDLVNQRQLIAAVAGTPAPHRRGDADLFAVISAFDAAYGAYADFQELMERYWSLRWLQQEAVHHVQARVVKGEIVRLQGLPMTTRLSGAASYERGQRLELEINQIDLIDLTPNARILRALAPDDQDLAADDVLAEAAEAPAAGDLEAPVQ